MLRSLFISVLNKLGRLINRRIVYFPEQVAVNNFTAVKSSVGFWYSGNVLDMSDIAHGILYNGVVEPDGTQLVLNILKQLQTKQEELVFYDIGANTGYFGVMAAYIGKGKIHTYSFEPIKKNNLIESETLSLNNLNSLCDIYNVALGDISGEAEFFLAGSGSSLSKDFLGNRHSKLDKVKVPVYKLDEFAQLHNLKLPDFMKIDVEGFELQVLKGSQRIISLSYPVIWYESALTANSNNFKNNSFFDTQSNLQNLGYKVFLCSPELQEVKSDKIVDGVSMYLALHLERHKDLLAVIGRLHAKN